MAEVGGGEKKVRVVRCPKCEKLLAEPEDFVVYKCGGCDATLQAKKQGAIVEASSDTSDGKKFKKPENPMSSSDTDFEADSSKCGTLESLNKEADSYISRSENRGSANRFLLGVDRHDSNDHQYLPKPMVIDEMQPKVQNELPNQHAKLPQVQTWKGEEKTSYCRASLEGIRFTPCPDEGPSNYHFMQNSVGPNRVENFKQDQAELLRKLDELKDQLRQSCEVANRTRERTPISRRTVSSSPYENHGRDAWFPDGSPSLNRTSSQHVPFLNGSKVDIPNFYQAMQSLPSDIIPGYRESLGSQTLGVAHSHHLLQCPRRPHDNYLYGHLDPNHAISYHHNSFCHQSACTCLRSCNRPCAVPLQGAPAIFCNQRPLYFGSDHGLYPLENTSSFRQHNCDYMVGSALHSHELQTNKGPTPTKKEGLSCRPVAGAAPFVVCYNCSKLLELPPKLLLAKKKQFKLQCGSCSQEISIELDGKRLITSAPIQTMSAISESSNGPGSKLKERLHCHNHINQFPVMHSSGDYDIPSYDARSADDKLVVLPSSNSSSEMLDKEHGFNLGESEKMQELSSLSSTPEDVESPDRMICHRDELSSAEIPVQIEMPTHVPGLQLREHFGYPSSNHVTNGPGKGSRSRRADQEKIVAVNGNFKQNSVKDVQVATEMDLSADDYPNPGVPQDPQEVGRDEDQPKAGKGGESFFAGLIKKHFKDFQFNQSTENGRSKVSINGHLISDRLVKKAEKQAGLIHPGDYWYDYRAGFWGVMGQPCLGIIPPFIEEFNYPMSKNCSGGNTGVLVNGRELHQKDLDLLVGRGLPPSEDCAYIIEISGKVWDEATGEELDCLGKLAPTVERVKHGFGMWIPSVIT